MTHLPKVTAFPSPDHTYYGLEPTLGDILEQSLANHRATPLVKPIYSRKGGLRWLRIGRLTLSWSWRRG